MDTIVLPGYSVHNKDWALEVKEKLAPDINVKVYEWAHWAGGNFSASGEAKKILDLIGSETVNVIGKSVGSGMALRVWKAVPGQINKVILCGIPLADYGEETKAEVGMLLKGVPGEKFLIIQNDADPHGGFAQVKNFLGKVNPEIKIIEKPAATHEYPYFEDFKKFLG